ncbi:MAG: hypothetical protein ACD_78C00274G0014 [uncultured bacterium (gcode 4)]|uniref:HTH cro/C1-type domain-containing protein n=1 Tax=uncultured bacterium (gcode 4) TaxID=1234023 RepID=K1XX39_9BACT|nr:MAG: hypothetical protein ACD_78C00274G0014 [uncultured bacterium (gcode 4)]
MKVEINLWELLGKNKMSARDLSKITGMSNQQISSIKRGMTSRIGLDTIEKLLEAFQCEPNDLFKIIK